MRFLNCAFSHTQGFILVILLLFASSSFAASPYPLNEPPGLAVDSNGNLYVANEASNQILVYNANYQQLTARTITTAINAPTGVAFDPHGNLFVANLGSNSITKYSSSGTELAGTITQGILDPRPSCALRRRTRRRLGREQLDVHKHLRRQRLAGEDNQRGLELLERCHRGRLCCLRRQFSHL